MKRYASHFIFLPGYGYMKQYVVEVKGGCAISLFPLTEEIEGVEWFPGVIALLTEKENDILEKHCDVSIKDSDIFEKDSNILKELPSAFCNRQFPAGLIPYLFFPFDFTSMQPVGGTRRRLLR